MGWFGRKSAVTASSAPLVPVWAGSQEGEAFPRSYQARFNEVYLNNPVGQRAVRLVAGATAALPIYASEGKERAVELIRKPGLMEAVAAQLLLHGNAFVQCVPTGRGLGVLFPLRPERVSIVTDEQGWPAAYLYRVGTGQPKRYPARDVLARTQIIHLRSLHPGDDHLGLGCMDAAISAASVHNRATRWNKSLLDNAARPSGALVYEPADGANLSAEQFTRLRSELDAQFSGSDNAGKPLLLEGGLKWQALSLTPADMDFIRLKEAAAREIALAFGVPPALLGLPGDATYANLREAGRALYRQTVLPLAKHILDGLSDGLSDWFGKVRVVADTDGITELAEDRERLWSQAEAASFLSRAEKRELVGYGPEEDA
ncbi:MAG TPA: phage portal protein [Sphingomicrobium sp.]|nr:phage portal protein [Sphingomicrobium sp.]